MDDIIVRRWAYSSVGLECLLDMQEVTGSNPVTPTFFSGLGSLMRPGFPCCRHTNGKQRPFQLVDPRFADGETNCPQWLCNDIGRSYEQR